MVYSPGGLGPPLRLSTGSKSRVAQATLFVGFRFMAKKTSIHAENDADDACFVFSAKMVALDPRVPELGFRHRRARNQEWRRLQGYLAHTKPPRPSTLQ